MCHANTAPVAAEKLGLMPTSFCTRIDTLCVNGSQSTLLAKAIVESAMADMVMVTGAENLHMPLGKETTTAERVFFAFEAAAG